MVNSEELNMSTFENTKATYHGGETAPQAPDVQTVPVFFIADEEFRAFVRSGSHSDIVFVVWKVELA